MNDHENALIAFRKSILCSKDAIKNPLIYLNYSIFAFNVLNDTVEAHQYLNNYYNLCEQIKVPAEVRDIESIWLIFFYQISLSFEFIPIFLFHNECWVRFRWK